MQESLRTTYASCPLCDATELRHVRSEDCTRHRLYRGLLSPRIDWMTCGGCGHVFTRGYFNEDGLRILFQGSGSSANPAAIPLAEMEPRRDRWGSTIARIAPFLSQGRWLDVGAGAGMLLRVAEELGYEVSGTDLRPDTVAALRGEGFTMHQCAIEDVPGDGDYDIVSLCDVLEHMPFPRRGLAAVARLLKPSGFVFVSLPNYDSPLWRAWDREGANPYWAEIEHYHNFSRQRLHDLLRTHGFDPVQTWISPRYRGCIDVLAARRP